MYRTAASRVTVTDYAESLRNRIINWLRGGGYTPANDQGVDLERYPFGVENELGILYEYPSDQPKKWLWVIPRKQRKFWLGTLRFSDHERWTLQTYGRLRLATATRLAEGLARAFDVSVDVHLRTENVRLELFSDPGREAS